jgi:heme-degrading monooxygenase HmoA
MYARVSTYEGSVEEYQQGLDKMRSDILPQVQAMPGCKGILSMVDKSTGHSLSITLWDSEDALTSTRETANRVRAEAAGATGASIADVTEYEVGIAELT